MTHLYDLTGQMIGLARMIEDGEMDAETLQDTLEALEGDLQVKTEGLLAYVANIGADVDSIDNEIKRLQARKKGMTNRQESLRDYLKHNMSAAGINRITCPLFSVTLTKPRAMAIIDDESLIPDEYTVIVPATKTVVKADLLRALKVGNVSGAHLGESQAGLLIK